MSLTKRDTFVRHLDPLGIIWEDAEGNVHFSIPDALKAFDLPDTPVYRALVSKMMEDVLRKYGADKIIHRPKPDSPDYWKTVPPDERPPEFRHLPFEDPT